jgi:hypothetical protein
MGFYLRSSMCSYLFCDETFNIHSIDRESSVFYYKDSQSPMNTLFLFEEFADGNYCGCEVCLYDSKLLRGRIDSELGDLLAPSHESLHLVPDMKNDVRL